MHINKAIYYRGVGRPYVVVIEQAGTLFSNIRFVDAVKQPWILTVRNTYLYPYPDDLDLTEMESYAKVISKL